MQSRSMLHDEFVAAIDAAEDQLNQHLELTDGELEEVKAGVASLPVPVRAACRVVLEDWEQLDAAARVAALLALANALATNETSSANAGLGGEEAYLGSTAEHHANSSHAWAAPGGASCGDSPRGS